MAKSNTNSKIENCIEEIENYIDSCKPAFLQSSKILVSREEMEVMLSDLRDAIPDEVERYRKIISNKEAIESEARDRAQRLIASAEMKTNELLSENEIMMQANIRAEEIVNIAIQQAQQIIDEATMQRNQYIEAAQQYLNDQLVNLNNIIYNCIDSTTKNTNKFLDSLTQVEETVQSNINELNQMNQEPEADVPVNEADNYSGEKSIFGDDYTEQ